MIRTCTKVVLRNIDHDLDNNDNIEVLITVCTSVILRSIDYNMCKAVSRSIGHDLNESGNVIEKY